MYLPLHFRLDDRDAQLALMRAHPFATLVADVGGELEAAHLPLLVDRDGERFVIHGHVARRNRLAQARAALAVFRGPHAYISASWYGAVDMVPTWNYLAVHAQGPLALVEEAACQRELFERLGATFEGERAEAWWRLLSDAAYERYCAAIVWFRIDVASLAAKAKLAQDDPAEGRARVIEILRARGTPDEIAIAEAMGKWSVT